ncbi:MAG: hypothetical protein J5737_06450 [Bacteroidales bacterium]|nr:hypothetical protein [Bacteroidales bacterium]
MKKLLIAAALVLVAAGALAQAPHKYGIKYGIVKTVTDAGGQKTTTTLWFDEYGARERSSVKKDLGNGMGEAEWVTISLPDGKSYLLDATRKTSTVIPRPDINYLNMSDEAKAARKAKIVGKETIDGLECDIWEENVKQILGTVKVVSWVWKGIPVKYTTDNPKSETMLSGFEQPASIDPSLFEIPADYKKK